MRLEWDDHHMMIAIVTAQRSPDPNTQVGACIVSEDNKVLATGYNAFPREVRQNYFPWDREIPPGHDELRTKYPFVVHAELNAIYNGTTSLKGGSLYVTLHPCGHCMQGIIQSGIKYVFYLENKYPDSTDTQAAIQMAQQANVSLIKHTWGFYSKKILETINNSIK